MDFKVITKAMFFDRKGIIEKMDRKTTKVLARTGGFARTTMKRGMRKRKGVSEPGAYPSSHEGSLRDLILFGYDVAATSVIVGPILFKTKRVEGGNRTMPQLINEGGTVQRTVVRKYKSGRTSTRKVTQHYQPRPFVDLTLPIAAKALADNMASIAL